MIGAEVKIPVKTRLDYSLFSESQSRVIVSVSSKNKDSFESILNGCEQKFYLIGKTGSPSLIINDEINVDLTRISDLYYNIIPNLMRSEK